MMRGRSFKPPLDGAGSEGPGRRGFFGEGAAGDSFFAPTATASAMEAVKPHSLHVNWALGDAAFLTVVAARHWGHLTVSGMATLWPTL
jgi:hypothetical protein